MKMTKQDINNQNSIETQIITTGNVNLNRQTRWGANFQKLKEEVEKDVRFDSFIEDFIMYNTVLDGKSMPEKLKDGGFSESEILHATMRKDKYAKKIVLP